jgi:hypothetical protein
MNYVRHFINLYSGNFTDFTQVTECGHVQLNDHDTEILKESNQNCITRMEIDMSGFSEGSYESENDEVNEFFFMLQEFCRRSV